MFERKMPEYFGGTLWADQTIVHPLGLLALSLAIVAVLCLSRRHLILPLILIAVAIPGAQRIVVFSLDFSFIRIVILTILSLAILRGHVRAVRFSRPDVIIVLWMFWSFIASGLLTGGISGVINAAGGAVNTVGAYFVGRIYIRSTNDMRRLLLWLAAISIPMLALFLVERITGHNIFSIFGGVPEQTIVRDGRLRVQGPFSHPIMAGVFWASLLPCIGAMWMAGSSYRSKLILPLICILFIVVNTASSTPLMGILLGMFGMSLYVFRYQLRLIVGAVSLILVTLHLAMETPVWHLLSRINLSSGSTGWHRYNLIEQSIRHFNEWWMYGVEYTGHWGWGLQDITNQYVFEGVSGGFLQLVLFVAFLTSVFLCIGRALRRRPGRAESWFLWGSGVCLFVHCMSFLAVSYTGQLVSLFYLFVGGTVQMTSILRIPTRFNVPTTALPVSSASQARPVG